MEWMRDPIWQVAGVFIAFIAIALPNSPPEWRYVYLGLAILTILLFSAITILKQLKKSSHRKQSSKPSRNSTSEDLKAAERFLSVIMCVLWGVTGMAVPAVMGFDSDRDLISLVSGIGGSIVGWFTASHIKDVWNRVVLPNKYARTIGKVGILCLLIDLSIIAIFVNLVDSGNSPPTSVLFFIFGLLPASSMTMIFYGLDISKLE